MFFSWAVTVCDVWNSINLHSLFALFLSQVFRQAFIFKYMTYIQQLIYRGQWGWYSEGLCLFLFWTYWLYWLIEAPRVAVSRKNKTLWQMRLSNKIMETSYLLLNVFSCVLVTKADHNTFNYHVGWNLCKISTQSCDRDTISVFAKPAWTQSQPVWFYYKSMFEFMRISSWCSGGAEFYKT